MSDNPNNWRQRRRQDRDPADRVQGPTSALTSFLREHGIVAPNIYESRRRREERRAQEARQQQQQAAAADGQGSATAATSATSDAQGDTSTSGDATVGVLFTPARPSRRGPSAESQAIMDRVMAGMKKKNKKEDPKGKGKGKGRGGGKGGRPKDKGKGKKRKKGDSSSSSDDSDFESDGDASEDDFGEGSSRVPFTRSRPGRTVRAFCDKCKCRFSFLIQDYDENPTPTTCPSCTAGGNDTKPAPKKRRTTKAKTSNSFTPPWKEKKGPSSLVDICIGVVGEYIEDVEALGTISPENMDKIAKLICRNRKLNNDTARLFMMPINRELTLYDCSNMDASSLKGVATFSPFLRELNLYYCGRMTDEVLLYYGERLQELHSITLSGCHLITEKAWIEFFKTTGDRLLSFSMRHSNRFNLAVFKAMLEYAPKLKHLRLGWIVTLDDAWLDQLLERGNALQLETLELSWPSQDPSNRRPITTDRIVRILEQTGGSLKELALRGCVELKDAVLLEGILRHCPHLSSLTLEDCPDITGDAFKLLFDSWKIEPVRHGHGLKKLKIARCTQFNDAALQALIAHSFKSLTHLNLNSCDDVSSTALEDLALYADPNATDKDTPNGCTDLVFLDTSFVRAMDDFVLHKLFTACQQLKKINVYGCHQISEYIKVPDYITLDGRESHMN
ncbi:hypothetical protein BC940DRAFT_262644 [Gongronella butleri]|nr:hypothetical protein BC940DRAFT_262644 [Gongronella butleri]